jgi:hypothetical protein
VSSRAAKLVRFVRGAYQNSPWLVIAIGLHAIALLYLSIRAFGREPEHEELPAVAIRQRFEPPPPAPLELPEVPPLRPLVPPLSGTVELVDVEPAFLPEPNPDAPLDEQVGTPDATGGEYTGIDTSTSVGVGPFKGNRGKERGGLSFRPGSEGLEGRDKRGSPPHRPPQDVEASILAGFTWLARHQSRDGGWCLPALRSLCDKRRPCIPLEASVVSHYDEGLTGLALLCFLGAGIDPLSDVRLRDPARARELDLGAVVKNGVAWLVKRQKADGSFSHARAFLYNEALATLAVVEAFAATRSPFYRRPAQRAVDFLVDAQKRGPAGEPWGWRYGSRAELEAAHARGEIDDETFAAELGDADISVTTWVVMALHGAREAGLDVPAEALQGGLAFARHVTGENGWVGYQSSAGAGKNVAGPGDHFVYHPASTSALGMVVRTFVARERADPFLEQAAHVLVRDLPAVTRDHLSIDYYYWYYGTLALNQLDGPDSPRASGRYWKPWEAALQEAILPLQHASKDPGDCRRGAWLDGDRWSYAGHALYSTALNVLTLEVYFRYANAFGSAQRETQRAR